MDAYYHTLSSLPTLLFDAPPPLSEEEFLAVCRNTMPEKAAATVAGLKFGTEPGVAGIPLIESWRAWLLSLRGELARARAQRLGRDAEKYAGLGGYSAHAQASALAALAESAPAQAELILLRAAWSCLDDLEVGHFFDLERVLVYALKLKIIGLKALRNKADGENRFAAICAAIFPRQSTLTESGERA